MSEREVTPENFADNPLIRNLTNRTEPHQVVFSVVSQLLQEKLKAELIEAQEKFLEGSKQDSGSHSTEGTTVDSGLVDAVQAFGDAANEHHQYLYDATVINPAVAFARFLASREETGDALRESA